MLKTQHAQPSGQPFIKITALLADMQCSEYLDTQDVSFFSAGSTGTVYGSLMMFDRI